MSEEEVSPSQVVLSPVAAGATTTATLVPAVDTQSSSSAPGPVLRVPSVGEVSETGSMPPQRVGSQSQLSSSGRRRRRVSVAQVSNTTTDDIIRSVATHAQTAEEAHAAVLNLEEKTLWHALTTRDCLRAVGMRHAASGLTSAEVVERRAALGDNSLDEGKSRSLWAIILPQFFNWMSAILFAVLVLALVLEEYIEAVVVILVILLNGSIGAWQEVRSEQSLSAIRDLARGTARVRRDGIVRTVDIQEVVIGDIIEFREGDQIPADARLLEATRVEIDEAPLTGESVPVHKTTAVLEDPEGKMPLGDRTNMAYRQTMVNSGHGTGVVVAVGSSTQIGKVAERLAKTSSGSTKTPLMKEMDALMLFLFCLGLVFAVLILWAFRFQIDSSSLLYASATLVAILPEVAIVLLSVVMALGSRRMAEQRAIVRRMAALERLGKVTDICSDKTGTLTAGKMQAVRVWLAAEIGVGAISDVNEARSVPLVAGGRPMSAVAHWHREQDGESLPVLQPEVDDDFGDEDEDEDEEDDEGVRMVVVGGVDMREEMEFPPLVERTQAPSQELSIILRQEWTLAMMVASLCSSTFVELSDEGNLTGTGNPTELALQVLAHQGQLAREAFMVDWESRGEWAFDSTAKRMSTGWRHRDLPVGLVISKGAPERILSICKNVGPEELPRISEAATHLARQGLRVLALAYRVVRNGMPRSASRQDVSDTASHSSTGYSMHRTPSSQSLVHRSASMASLEGGRERRGSVSRHLDAAHAQRTVQAPHVAIDAVRALVTFPAISDFLEGDHDVEGGEEVIIDLREHLVGDYDREVVERDLTFIGLVGLRDPPKLESGPAVQECAQAGITVRMLTGDHRETAIAIAKEIGILKPELAPSHPPADVEEVRESDEDERWGHLVMTGPEVDDMSLEELRQLPELPLVVARCTPETKVRMVEALHERKRVVAMTGDGVNDSPAIKAADVGVAMGITGSELTKSVADVVLADDNFATIVTAVREGRRMFNSISKFVLHLLCGNMAEAVVLMLSLAFVQDSDDLPVFVLAPLAILWLNTLTGTGPAMGISVDPTPPDMMQRPPLDDTLFTWELIEDTLVYGTVMGILTLSAFSVVVWADGEGQLGQNCNISSGSSAVNCGVATRGRAVAFALLNILLLLHAYNCRHERFSAFSMSWTKNKTLWWSLIIGIVLTVVLIYLPFINEKVFKHSNISWEWGIVAVGVVVFHLLSELYKWIKRILWDRKSAKLAHAAKLAAFDATSPSA